jgi:hypothetical protein
MDERPSLIWLRKEVNARLPRVDLPEAILEVMSWYPEFVAAFTAASGGQTRLDDLDITIAACLTAHALNIGFAPIVKKGVKALERDRISHVNQKLHGHRDLHPRQPAADRRPSRDRTRAGLGRWPCRRDRRDALRRPGA